MSGIRKLVLAAALAGLALLLPAPSQATKMCTSGGPSCNFSNASLVCNPYCQQKGMIWDYCNIQNGCCYCVWE